MEDNNHRDIIIVGGGIGGLYLAHQLERKEQYDWMLLEASDRLGGKVESLEYPYRHQKGALKMEWGAIRFEWGCQPKLEKLIEEEGIPLKEFPAFCGDGGWELDLIKEVCTHLWRLYLDYKQFQQKSVLDEYTDEELWNYLQANQKNFLTKTNEKTSHQWDLDSCAWLPVSKDNPKENCVHPYEFQFGDWLMSYDTECYQKMILAEKSIRAFIVLEFTVLAWLMRWTKVLLSNQTIKTCLHGNHHINVKLAEKLPSQKIRLQHQLKKIFYQENSHYQLFLCDEFDQEYSLTCKKLVLAIPPQAIKKIIGIPSLLNSLFSKINGYQLARIFVEVADPWWEEKDFFTTQHSFAEQLYSREVYYYGMPAAEKRGVIMMYFDEPYINYWRHFMNGDPSTYNDQLKPKLAQLLGMEESRILSVQHRFWDGRQAPYALNYLQPKVSPRKVMEQVSQLNQGSLCLVGDTYSFDCGFIEGVLSTCELALNNCLLKQTQEPSLI